MAQPIWLTDAGSLGVIPEGIFYQVPIRAYDPDRPDDPDAVYYVMIAGALPPGVQCTRTGLIEGIPQAIASLQGVPLEVSEDVTFRFAVRAYTERTVNGREVIDRVNDRTFTLTITGQDIPDFVTPAGNVGTFYDGTEVAIQIEFTDTDPDDRVTVGIISGGLPPGLVISESGVISGVIAPLIGPPGTARAGYDDTPKDEYPNDFTNRSTSKNYQFTLEVTDGKDSNTRTFEIYVYSKDSMTADTTDFTADNTFITADIVPTRTPVLLTPPGDLGRVRSDNFYSFKFDAIDFDGDAIEYSITTGLGVGFDETLYDQDGIGFDRGAFSLPPGLFIDEDTGWFYGYIPDQGATETTYRFAVRVLKRENPSLISPFYYFTITIIGNIDTEVIWLTDPDLGFINNGAISTLAIAAENVGGRSLQYRVVTGTNSSLPQGLTLLPSGLIVGRVSFNTFALDGGTTTFDTIRSTRLDPDPTTFDMTFAFDVNAFAPQTEQLGYQVSELEVINGGSGYTTPPTVTIQAPPATEGSVQATAGTVILDETTGAITSISVGNPGRGYVSPPLVTITGGGGSGAEIRSRVVESEIINAVSVVRRFTLTLVRAFNEPYENLYIKCMPPQNDRDLVNQLLQNQDIIPSNLIYRADDPNFGVAKNVVYVHALGLNSVSIDRYVQSLALNHYWRSVTLGGVETAQALDSDGNVVYEVVYSPIIDDLVNDQGISVSKSVNLPYPVITDTGTVSVVYPNSLDNMRDQVIASVGQISPALPTWMTSKQANGTVLGFTPAWIICYTQPGRSGQIKYNIQQQFANQLNRIDFEIDRYELDRSQTYLWDPETDKWIPSPAQATTFDTISRPLDITYIGDVTYATELAYVDINNQTLDSIAARGGIDGIIGRQISGKTLIFLRQQNFGSLTPDQAFTDYTHPFDTTGYSADNDFYDESVIIPVNQRLAIYNISVSADNIVTLTQQRQVAVLDWVRITQGRTWQNTPFYVPTVPNPGQSFRTWTVVQEQATVPTIFDGGSTRFIAPADRWTSTNDFDKYLVFPKRTILG